MPNLGPVIGPYFSHIETEIPKFYNKFPNVWLFVTFWWKFHENRTKNNEVTTDYI